jgi:urease accessory protein
MKALRHAAALLALAGATEPCLAHGFSGNGWMHPLTGVDHMLAMVAVGLWSAQLGGRALFVVPLAFVAAMAVGSVAGVQQWQMPAVESIVAMSVLVLGGAIALASRAAWPVACAAALLFGLAHGYVHGAEMPLSADKLGYAAGFLLTTAGLHVAGAVAGLLVLEQPAGRNWLRSGGTLVAAAGAMLLQSAQ